MGFFEGLEENIRAASEEALLKSVVADPDQSLGKIMAALEGEDEAKYLLVAFKELTVGQIVQAAMVNIEAAMEAEQKAAAPAPTPPQGRNGVKAPKKAPPKVAPPKAGKESSSGLNLSTPEAQKAYENAILKALKAGKHVDEHSAITSQNLRKIVGGDASQARKVLDQLIASDRAGFCGKARGTKYYSF